MFPITAFTPNTNDKRFVFAFSQTVLYGKAVLFAAFTHIKTVLEEQTLKGECFHGKHKQVKQKGFSHREQRENGASAFPNACQENGADRNVQCNIGDFGLLIACTSISGGSVFRI